MPHFVFELDCGGYVGTRKYTSEMYVCRTSVAEKLDQARVFNTAAAATRSGRDAGFDGKAARVMLSIQS